MLSKKGVVVGLCVCILWVFIFIYFIVGPAVSYHEIFSGNFYNLSKEKAEEIKTRIQDAIGAKPTFNKPTPTKTLTSKKPRRHYDEEQLHKSLMEAANTTYKIVIWEPPFGSMSSHHEDTAKCGLCNITYEKSEADNPDTKAIVFHFNEVNINAMPEHRRTDQYYVWWAMESSQTINQHGRVLDEFDDVFNLTMTVRRDSDVYNPYGYSCNLLSSLRNSGSGDPQKDVDDLLAKKKYLALWIVSNCGTTPGAMTRMTYSNQLVEAGLDLDRRGGCFPNNKPVEDRNIIREFKFYMAFENSIHCLDYVTEKLFENGLRMGAVPVVLGAFKSDLEAILPPHSCIYVDDFDTPSKLVEYLHYLNNNDTAYKEYFHWRTMKPEDMPDYGRTGAFCSLCRILHGINVDNIYNPRYDELYSNIPLFGYPDKPRIVSSLRQWFYGMENRECLPAF